MDRLEVLLAKIDAGKATVCQIRHPMMKRFTRTLKDGRVKLNAMKVREDAKYDGKYVLRTTSDLFLADAVAAYKTLYRIERGFRTIKSVLRIRSMYHHADHRIIRCQAVCSGIFHCALCRGKDRTKLGADFPTISSASCSGTDH